MGTNAYRRKIGQGRRDLSNGGATKGGVIMHKLAVGHSEDMASNKEAYGLRDYKGGRHGPKAEYRSMIMGKMGSRIAENQARIQSNRDPDQVIEQTLQGWENCRGHDKNMLGQLPKKDGT